MKKKNINFEISEDFIEEYSQCGPQEEMIIQSYPVDIKKWRIYHQKKNKKENKN